MREENSMDHMSSIIDYSNRINNEIIKVEFLFLAGESFDGNSHTMELQSIDLKSPKQENCLLLLGEQVINWFSSCNQFFHLDQFLDTIDQELDELSLRLL